MYTQQPQCLPSFGELYRAGAGRAGNSVALASAVSALRL